MSAAGEMREDSSEDLLIINVWNLILEKVDIVRWKYNTIEPAVRPRFMHALMYYKLAGLRRACVTGMSRVEEYVNHRGRRSTNTIGAIPATALVCFFLGLGL
jgi:hypothetical protein